MDTPSSQPEDADSHELASSMDHSSWDLNEEEQDWSENEIERAYQQALEASGAVGLEMPDEVDVPVAGESDSFDAIATEMIQDAATDETAENTEQEKPATHRRHDVSPLEVVESLLFVGGEGVTVKKMARVLSGNTKPEKVESYLEQLNARYLEQGRPYEIQLAEGGYRLRLRSDFERIRNRVYGLSPKEVRLSQDAMEVLAFVAYRQPTTKADVESTGKPNCANLLRQLVRRQLLELQRDEETGKNVLYVTTQRFLQLFGINSLKELPRREQIAVK